MSNNPNKYRDSSDDEIYTSNINQRIPKPRQRNHQNYSDDDDETQLFNYSSGSSQGSRHTRKKNDLSTDGMGTVMGVMNKLYDVFNRLKLDGKGINLPQIVVCGSQSAGKTSILESIAGEEFLPRGTGIQTRCPIVLQLVHTKGNSKWMEFGHDPERKYEDWNEVKSMIEELTMDIERRGEVVTRRPITMKIYSPEVVDLTLVDLPGLVENCVDGQPEDLVEKIQELVLKYIQNPNSIILAVTAATTDIADSKCIRMAREVDPDGVRTLGVLTKLDLMDQGTTASEVLEGKKIKLKLGIVGVVNRSFSDTQKGKSVSDGLEKERKFLAKHYPKICSEHGTSTLINKTSSLLLNKITKSLPSVKARVEELIFTSTKRIQELGGDIQAVDKQRTFIHHIDRFNKSYCGEVDGRRRDVSTTKVSTSSKIKVIFDTVFKQKVTNLKPDSFTDEEISNAVLNSHALHSLQSVADDAFQELAKRVIQKLRPLVMNCTELVYMEMLKAIKTCFDPEATVRYPKLNNNIEVVASDLINQRYMACKTYLEDYMNAEAAIAKTSKPQFLKLLQSISKKGGVEESNSDQNYNYKNSDNERSNDDTSDGEAFNDSDSDEDSYKANKKKSFAKAPKANGHGNVRKLIQCYFDLSKTDMIDHVPKAIAYKLVYGVVDEMNKELMMTLNTADKVEELMLEAGNIKEIREKTVKLLNGYKEAREIIDEILCTTIM
ncbi:unnamed protein product [Orchesella dallaii]|uniref:Dynamin-1-like protein n=1 Tax=Orchesella dallaii TaxID=48710 RepID=A0ABP1RJ56_9HEXA